MGDVKGSLRYARRMKGALWVVALLALAGACATGGQDAQAEGMAEAVQTPRGGPPRLQGSGMRTSDEWKAAYDVFSTKCSPCHINRWEGDVWLLNEVKAYPHSKRIRAAVDGTGPIPMPRERDPLTDEELEAINTWVTAMETYTPPTVDELSEPPSSTPETRL